MPIRPPVALLAPLLLERERLTHAIAQTINQTFLAADVGCVGQPGEVDRLVYFFLEGLPALEEQFNRILRPHKTTSTLSGIFCHQTPKVHPDPLLKPKSGTCELGDLLFLVTYGHRLYDRILGNALLVQAKEDVSTVHGTLQDYLYSQAAEFTYRSPRTLAGQSRKLNECRHSLWYWGFDGVHWWPRSPLKWHTGGIRARMAAQFSHPVPFEFALMDLICGVNGRRASLLQPDSTETGWSRIVDDVIRNTARSAFTRQNAYVSRNREPLRGEDAVRAINSAMGSPAPFLIRSSLGRILGMFDEELARLGAALEQQSASFDEAAFKAHQSKRLASTGDALPPILGNARPAAADDDDGGCSFVIMDFSQQ